MSGATAAHASYNGSGTQGIAVTNKLNDTGDIISTIWGKDDTTKQLLHGASLIEIPSSGGGTSPGSVYTFTLNSDMDAIGDMYGFATFGIGGNVINPIKHIGFLSVINRIEFHCGTQIWQTLEQEDLVALNTTELSEAAYEKFILSSLGYISDVSFNRGFVNIVADSELTTRVISFKIPLLTRKVCPIFNNFSNVTEAGFLTACAPNQTVKIRIFTNTFSDMFADGALDDVTTGSLDLRLFGNHLVMCNEEREKIRNIPGGIAKRVKITQNANLSSFPAPRNGVVTAIIDCDHFSLFASHLIIRIHDTSSLLNNGTLVNNTDASLCSLIDADLRLNNTSYCGRLTGAVMSGPLADSMGLYVNTFTTRTITGPDTLVYVFPLSNYAFSGAGVPLNRFDNIRLTIRIALDNPLGVLEELSRVSVTCVGESTALYKQGAASISMY